MLQRLLQLTQPPLLAAHKPHARRHLARKVAVVVVVVAITAVAQGRGPASSVPALDRMGTKTFTLRTPGTQALLYAHAF